MQNATSERRALRCIALLGRPDHPTDALEDYCVQLARALGKKKCVLELVRVPWAERGWRCALREVNRRFAAEPEIWVLVQYTALAWSRRGFPVRFVTLIDGLRRAGARILIVFHDPEPFGGSRLIDRLRRHVQLAVMRRVARGADKIVSTFSPERVPWMRDPAIRAKSIALAVGSNLPVMPRNSQSADHRPPHLVVFGWSNIAAESAVIAEVLRRAAGQAGPLRLTVFGRGGKAAGAQLRRLLQDTPVELDDFGILEADRASGILANADVQLFVRSGLTPCRGSAIAGIVCGLPVVGFSDGHTEFPITEAGVRLVPRGDTEGLARELLNVLQQPVLRDDLRRRNLAAAELYFSWDRIADAYLSLLWTNA